MEHEKGSSWVQALSRRPSLCSAVLHPPLHHQSSDWSELPSDILCEISRHLTLKDYFSFLQVCKSWRQAISTSAFSTGTRDTMLIVYDNEKNNYSTTCYIYNLSAPSLCGVVNLPELANSTCIGSNQGWLLLEHTGTPSVQLFNPFSCETVELPPFPSELTTERPLVGSLFPSSSYGCLITVQARKIFPGNKVLRGACYVGDKCWNVELTPLTVSTSKSTSGKMSHVPWRKLLARDFFQQHGIWERFVDQTSHGRRKGFNVNLCKSREWFDNNLKVRFTEVEQDEYYCGFSDEGLVEIEEKKASLPLVNGIIIEPRMPRLV